MIDLLAGDIKTCDDGFNFDSHHATDSIANLDLDSGLAEGINSGSSDQELCDLTNIKILVAYHKKYALIQNESYYISIHAGREVADHASKDGRVSANDLEWFNQVMIGDNTGDNISYLNRHAGEMTVIYWAWKNYDQLGNPAYIGLNHYRRIMHFDSDLCEYNVYCLNQLDFSADKTTLFTQYARYHYREDLELALLILKELYPQDALGADEYMNLYRGYYIIVFFMKKDLFFEYCEWIFPILLEIQKHINYSKYKSIYQIRVLAFLAERLTGIFLYKKIKDGKKLKEVSLVALQWVRQ